MKQLLACCGSHVLVALDDRAYVLLSSGSSRKKDGAAALERSVAMVELLTPPVVLAHAAKNAQHGGNLRKKKKTNDDDANGAIAATPPIHNPVQCVAALEQGDRLLCAVSRFDKSLSVYHLDLTTTTTTATAAAAVLNYATAKRSCGLTFATVSRTPMVIAADLTGDACAYPVLVDDGDGDNTTDRKRLLLGHTASMLTCVRVQGDRVLTSDRDEKVRVSRFPHTQHVEGYLLGHTAFVSALDVANDVTRCVTGSGDGTVRLWDYDTCKELACVEAIKLLPSNNKNDDDNVTPHNKVSSNVVVPSAVTLSADGTTAVVARDGSKIVQVVTFLGDPDDDDKTTTTRDIVGPAPPLALALGGDDDPTSSWLYVLTCDVDHLLRCYDASSSSFTDVTATSPICRALVVDKATKLTMPTTVMEHDAASGQLKMLKGKDTLGFAPHNNNDNNNDNTHNNDSTMVVPWNRIERREKDRLKRAKRKRRKREEEHKWKDKEDGEGGEYGEEEIET